MQGPRVASGPSNTANLAFVAGILQEKFNSQESYISWVSDAMALLEAKPDSCANAFEYARGILIKSRDDEGQLEIDLEYIKNCLGEKHQSWFVGAFFGYLALKVDTVTKESFQLFEHLYIPLMQTTLPQKLITELLVRVMKKHLSIQ